MVRHQRTVGGGPAPDDPPRLSSLLARWRRDLPHATAIRVADRAGWTSATWREVEVAARAAAAADRLFPAGAPVLVVVDNSLDAVVVLLGLWQAGRSTLLLESGSSHLSDPRSVVWSAGVAGIVGPRSLVDGNLPTGGMSVPVANAGRPAFGYARLLTTAAGARTPPLDEDPQVMQLTSGSTGEPRVAVQTLSNLLRGGAVYTAVHALTASDRILAPVPLAHSFGVVGGLAASLCSGAQLKTMSQLLLRRLFEGMSEAGTVLLGTPLLFRLATDAAARFPPRAGTVRLALSSGGPLPEQTAVAVRTWLGRWPCQLYGSTETGLISCQFERARPWPAGSVGVPAPGVTVRAAVGPDGGDVEVRTSTLFRGYLGHPWDGEYYHIGDVGRVDEDGHLFLLGRKSTFVNVGGRKINVARTERIIRDSGLVRDVAVYGVDHGEGDEEIHAAVEAGAEASVAAIREFCRRRLAPHEVPLVFHALDRLPRGPLGKVERGRLPGVAGSGGT